MDSILNSVKIANGITEDNTDFDDILIMYTNAVLSTILPQLGVGPEKGYVISDSVETWDDYLENYSNLEAVKTYVPLKVRMIFDPPSSSAVAEAIKSTIAELEFRLNIVVDTGKVGEEGT